MAALEPPRAGFLELCTYPFPEPVGIAAPGRPSGPRARGSIHACAWPTDALSARGLRRRRPTCSHLPHQRRLAKCGPRVRRDASRIGECGGEGIRRALWLLSGATVRQNSKLYVSRRFRSITRVLSRSLASRPYRPSAKNGTRSSPILNRRWSSLAPWV
jgi:hypothetical protein